MNTNSSELSPKQIVNNLDAHIIGQQQAKRAVAVALRNRWRRMQVEEPLHSEIVPKNILMIGPTGVGKTEIARRLASLANAPFLKVEATKFTEVGYVGRDVESIIRDLAETSVKMCMEQERDSVREEVQEAVLDRIADKILPSGRKAELDPAEGEQEGSKAWAIIRQRVAEGKYDDQEISLQVKPPSPRIEFMGSSMPEEFANQFQDMLSSISKPKDKKVRMKVRDAKPILLEQELDSRINPEEVKARALANAENNGIVFLDEIDKIASEEGRGISGGPSRQGVQRDLLPLIEGTQVKTKHGTVDTNHILFIASGAFHLNKPSDLIPELQGRLPIRVELQALNPEDFARILVEPEAALTKQYQALLATEGMNVSFSDDAIEAIAQMAWQVNDGVENIGARRLHTIMEKLFESLSFDAPDLAPSGGADTKEFVIDQQYVQQQLEDLVKDQDLSRYIL